MALTCFDAARGIIDADLLGPAAGAQVGGRGAHLVQNAAKRFADRLQPRPGLGGGCSDGAADAVDERPSRVVLAHRPAEGGVVGDPHPEQGLQ